MYIRSSPKRGIIFLLWFLVFAFSGLFVWLVLEALKPFDFIDALIGATAVGFFALYGWYTVLLEVNVWEVQADIIHVRDLAGIRLRSFQPSEITQWTELQKSNKYSNWKVLRLQTANGSFRLFSSGVQNYEDLKHAVLQRAPINQWQDEAPDHRNKLRILVTIGLVLITSGGAWGVYDIRTPEPPVVTACFDAVLSAAPVHETGSKNSAWMHFPVLQYPELNFSIADNDGSYQSAAVGAMRKKLHQGDTVRLCIDTTDYNLYIAKTRGPDFWERAAGYGSVRLLGIQTPELIYLDPAKIHAWNKDEPGPWILLILFGVMFIAAALAFRRYNPKA